MKSKFLFLLIISFGLLHAQTGNEFLKKIQNKFKSVSDFSADFSQFVTEPEGKQGTKISGKFYYKRKNKFIVELKNGKIISNGETVWNYDVRQKRVVISNFSDDPTSFSIERYVFDYPSECEVNLVKSDNGKDDYIELVPKRGDLDFNSAKIWKNSDDLIIRMEIEDISDYKYSIILNNINTDSKLSDDKFNFNPPKGIKIIDLR